MPKAKKPRRNSPSVPDLVPNEPEVPPPQAPIHTEPTGVAQFTFKGNVPIGNLERMLYQQLAQEAQRRQMAKAQQTKKDAGPSTQPPTTKPQ